MKKEAPPTFEEFYELTKKDFWYCWDDQLNEEQVDAYLQSEEAMRTIRSTYRYCMGRFERGEMTRTQFMNADPGHCLSLMY